jgi:ATP phosphoribosyltransferase
MNPARPLEEDAPLRLALPKGRMQKQVLSLMDAAGLHVDLSERTLRPRVAAEWLSPKLLKPQNIVTMLHEGSRELGFTGADWVREAGGELIELLDTGLDPVRIVVAAPTELLENGELPQRPLVIASELERITTDFIAERGMGDRFVRTYGATEVFPPEDADVIVDVVQTGSTLVANGLVEVQTLMRSSTRLWAHPGAYADAARRAWIDRYVLLISSVLEGRKRAMVEFNVTEDALDELVAALPCMRQPTVSRLHSGAGYAIRIAVPRRGLPELLPEIKARGGMDLVVTLPDQIIR